MPIQKNKQYSRKTVNLVNIVYECQIREVSKKIKVLMISTYLYDKMTS